MDYEMAIAISKCQGSCQREHSSLRGVMKPLPVKIEFDDRIVYLCPDWQDAQLVWMQYSYVAPVKMVAIYTLQTANGRTCFVEHASTKAHES
jgi:hypothetical protein